MITIPVSNEARPKIAAGDMVALRKVIEAESDKVKEILLSSAKPDDFRFYQGVAQALSGVIKLLP